MTIIFDAPKWEKRVTVPLPTGTTPYCSFFPTVEKKERKKEKKKPFFFLTIQLSLSSGSLFFSVTYKDTNTDNSPPHYLRSTGARDLDAC